MKAISEECRSVTFQIDTQTTLSWNITFLLWVATQTKNDNIYKQMRLHYLSDFLNSCGSNEIGKLKRLFLYTSFPLQNQ